MAISAEIRKVVDDEQLVFGWAWVSTNKDGSLVIDSQGESIETAELEKAAYDYVLNARIANDSHSETDIGEMVESMVVTPEKAKAMGFELEQTGWWVGYHIPDAEVFAKVKSGEFRMFSIEGVAGEMA